MSMREEPDEIMRTSNKNNLYLGSIAIAEFTTRLTLKYSHLFP